MSKHQCPQCGCQFAEAVLSKADVPAEWYEDMRANWEREKLRADELQKKVVTATYDPATGKCQGDCDCAIGQRCKAYLVYRSRGPEPTSSSPEPGK